MQMQELLPWITARTAALVLGPRLACFDTNICSQQGAFWRIAVVIKHGLAFKDNVLASRDGKHQPASGGHMKLLRFGAQCTLHSDTSDECDS